MLYATYNSSVKHPLSVQFRVLHAILNAKPKMQCPRGRNGKVSRPVPAGLVVYQGVTRPMPATYDGYISLRELTRQLDCDPATLRRKLARAGVGTYIDPTDSRRRLVAQRDAAELLAPRPSGRLAM
jgi:hypothetical protein